MLEGRASKNIRELEINRAVKKLNEKVAKFYYKSIAN